MFSYFFVKSRSEERYMSTAILTGIIIGIASIFVKWGSGTPMPPFPPGFPPPPVAIMHDLGFKDPMYTFMGNGKPWGMIIHSTTGIIMALIYTIGGEIFPRWRALRGALYGVGTAIVAHGILLPLMGYQGFFWQAPWGLHMISEIFGSALTFWICHEMMLGMRFSMNKPLPKVAEQN